MNNPEISEYTNIKFKYLARDNFISVIIPVYNDAEGLGKTLSSLAEQTLPKSDYEIIVANDGGSSSISDLCRLYDVQEVIIHPNRGSYFARNRALEEAHGEYFAFIDADITVNQNWLETGKNALRLADYVGGPVEMIEENARTPADFYEISTGFKGNKHGNGHNFYVTANLFVKRNVIEGIGGFDQRLRSSGDNEFGNRVFLSERYRQYFEDTLVVFHPPRGYKKLVKQKIIRAEGKKMLNRFYPDRYNYSRPSVIKLFFGMFFPPGVNRVKKSYRSNAYFKFIQYYFFIWRYKIDVSLRLIPVHIGIFKNT
jgi:glycosyltransferase AglI